MSEKLSALIDNELDDLERARMLKDLGGDSSLADLWSRYHLIGLAMRREAMVADGNLIQRVSARLETEVPGAKTSRRRMPAVLHSASRFAVAASVAGVLLIGGLVVKLYEDADTVPAGGAGEQLASAEDGMRWEGTADPRTEDALNALLVEHGEFTSASGMNGLTAYTKFVAYDSP